MSEKKRKKTNYELSNRIKLNKQRMLKINDSIKQASIKKTVLTHQIDADTDELCSRFIKLRSKKKWRKNFISLETGKMVIH